MTRPAAAVHAGTPPSSAPAAWQPAGALRVIRSCWQILVADDEPAVHQATRLALAGTEVQGRPVHLLHALSSEAARELLQDNPEVALVLLDPRMEADGSGLDYVRYARERLGRQALRIVMRSSNSGQGSQAAQRAALSAYDISGYQHKPELTAIRLFGTVAASLRTYRDLRALERTRAGLRSMTRDGAALFAATDLRAFAAEALRQLASLPFFRAAALIDVTGPDAGLPQVGCAIVPHVVAHLGEVRAEAALDLPPTLLAHARVLPRLLVVEDGWHACCLCGDGGRRVVLVLRCAPALGEEERRWLDAYIRHLVLAFDNVQLASESAVLSRLAGQLPELMLRLAEDGTLLSANEAAGRLLQHWHTPLGERAPAPWCERVAEVLALERRLDTEVAIDEQLFELSLRPVPEQRCVDLFGRELLAYRQARSRLLGESEAAQAAETLRDDAASASRATLERRLREALALGRLALDYLPVVDLSSRRIVGAQARLRLADLPADVPAAGQDELLAAAEDAGLLSRLGHWMLARALADLKHWHRLGEPALRVAVRVSARQLRDPLIARRVRDALAHAGVPGSALEMELADPVPAADAQSCLSRLRELRALGITLSLDHLGSGCASLGQLRSLRVGRLHLGSALVGGLAQGGQAQAVAEAVISLAHSLRLGVVAQGVSSAAQAALLQALGCEQAEGPWFAGPLPPADFESLLCRGSLPGTEEG